jgi:hypothetical protein
VYVQIPALRATGGGVGQPSSERITLALIAKAVADLQHLQDSASLSETDLVNRAISLYEFIDWQMRAGKDLLMRDNKSGKLSSCGSGSPPP